MPKLRAGERMQRCEYEDHAKIRSQKYYISRKYYTDIEKHFCQGCLQILALKGPVRYRGIDGYEPVDGTSIETILNIYGKGVKA